MAGNGPLRVALDEGVLRLTLDRPDKRNALSPDLIGALRAALHRAATDPDVRAVLLRGEGPAFCAGGDLDAMRARRGDAMATKRAQEDLFGALARDVLLLEKPIIADVHGDAFGAGLMLVLAADVAIASPKARFAASFVKVGLAPDTGGTWLLPKLLGLRQARELALLGDPLDAATAKAWGLVNDATPDHAAAADALAARFAKGATRAIGLTKRAILLGAGDTLEGSLAREASLQALLFTTKDHAEGVDAFLEKRPAAFGGH